MKLNYDKVATRTVEYGKAGITKTVPTDEKGVKDGDVVIFLNAKFECIHSCIMKKVVFDKANNVDLKKSTVSTKNGIQPLTTDANFERTILVDEYKPAHIGYFRPK